MKLALILASILASVLVACGGKPPPVGPAGSGSGNEIPHIKDTRSKIEIRRDTACELVGTRLTGCALEDAKAELAAGKVSKKDFDLDTAPDVLRKNTEEFIKKCEVPMTSRQVRVLEVCLQAETLCGPFADCLTHLSDGAGK